MELEEYINIKYNGDMEKMMLEELNSVANQQRLYDVEQKKDYLMGHHKIKNLPSYSYNGETITPTKLVLNTAKTILQQQSQFLLRHPVTLTGDELMVDTLSKVNRMANFNSKNKTILDNVLTFGSCSEIIHINKKGNIDSQIIPPDEGCPVWNRNNEMIAFIQSYVFDSISYYTLFTEQVVYEYSNEGGSLHLVSSSPNLGGLPIYYHSHNSEYSQVEGRSVLDDFIGILDSLELLISRNFDSSLLYSQGIPILKGQRLTNGGIPQEIIGGGLYLDSDAEFSFESNDINIDAFEKIYNKLYENLLINSGTSSVSMGKFEISNISETSLRLMFSMAEVRAFENESYMRDGMMQRYEVVRRLLEYQGVTITDDELASLSLLFQYNQPLNSGERIEELKVLRELGAMSMETLLEQSPYTTNVQQEVERMKAEGIITDNIRVDTSEG